MSAPSSSTPERWEAVKTLFHAALERAPEERAAFLAAASGDEWVRCEVESLLASHDDGEEFLGVSVVAAAALGEEAGGRLAGERVGPYRIVREIGRGGMGAVYLAERDDDQYRQHVAIKLIKRGMDTDQILKRFRRERQITAGKQQFSG